MYLKKVEFLGFKSFAERTVMNFLPGMTSIVGPNGCGKSNIADAVRWVLGEQSAKALRGGKMMDVIFNGADGYKPTNMAEVSLTMAECEDALKTDYHEVTITRRLFRSGDSEYYLNKQPCRLKDIHRLFMDTGVGKNSYSILEQGKIDQILSSRPEDRRIVFEEASGITKFKADRREALGKLERTEQNLQRLDDVIREVKRRMVSLQRQAGKARRYQEIQNHLRGQDMWLSRHRVQEMSEAIGDIEVRLDELHKQMDQGRVEIENEDQGIANLRTELEAVEKVIADQMESAVGIRNELHQAKEAVRVNGERIEEMKSYANRDSKDAEEAQTRLEQHRQNLEESAAALVEAKTLKEEAEAVLKARQEEVKELETTSAELREKLRTKRNQVNQFEQAGNKAQGKIRDFEQRERGRMVQQERLREGISELQNAESAKEEKVQELTGKVELLQERELSLRTRVDQGVQQQQEQGSSLKEKRQALGEFDKNVAGLKARLDVLRAQEAEQEQFPAGARVLLSKDEIAGLDRSCIVGALAQKIRTNKESQKALESLLRSTIDAVIVKDAGDLKLLWQILAGQELGAARILAIGGVEDANVPDEGPGEPFVDRVRASAQVQPLVNRMFRGVRWVKNLEEAGVPAPGQVFVSPEGHLLKGDGSLEVYTADQDQGNPLALQARITETEQALRSEQENAEDLRARLEAAQGEEAKLQERLRNAREEMQQVNRELAGSEAELRNAKMERDQGKVRLQQLTNQLKTLDETHQASDQERQEMVEEMETARANQERLRGEIEAAAQAFDAAEEARNLGLKSTTDHRIKFAEHRQKVELLTRQQQNLQERITELETTVRERNEGINTYEQRVLNLKEDMQSAQAKIAPLEEQLNARNAQIEKEREQRSTRQEGLRVQEQALREKRLRVEKMTGDAGNFDVDLAQRRVRLENLIQRVTEAYHISLGEIQKAEEPEWEDGSAPDWSELERTVEAMKQKLEQMGPVNMVAIEEYQEQEDRFQFLMAQQEDLVEAKKILLESIESINATTTEMFNKTFDLVNVHFQEMFKKLFGGGEAFLELVDDDDVLESGIDIVAKPPGKKPQVISLLSGGERTMTAVALLFALYTVKPSPFCILDELDAALDDANIGRFVSLVQSFVKESQFIVITHNQKTIAAADVLYGITQEHKGVSKVVSVKLTDHDKDQADVRKSKQLADEEAPAPEEPAATEDSPATDA
ncbi:chromosome segregation protein SMC [Kiritimatiellota bacterium B12222]|nr:chromosome segregation protein SMC [Kiritimatiellota bacterium B12222]